MKVEIFFQNSEVDRDTLYGILDNNIDFFSIIDTIVPNTDITLNKYHMYVSVVFNTVLTRYQFESVFLDFINETQYTFPAGTMINYRIFPKKTPSRSEGSRSVMTRDINLPEISMGFGKKKNKTKSRTKTRTKSR